MSSESYRSEERPLRSEQPLSVTRLEDRDDGRGSAFYLPDEALGWLGGVEEMHLVTIRPGAIRGNHVHHRRREVIVVRSEGPWELAWRVPAGASGESGEGGEVERRRFEEGQGVLVCVEPGVAHALKNLGDRELVVASCSSGRFDPEEPDTERVELLS